MSRGIGGLLVDARVGPCLISSQEKDPGCDWRRPRRWRRPSPITVFMDGRVGLGLIRRRGPGPSSVLFVLALLAVETIAVVLITELVARGRV